MAFSALIPAIQMPTDEIHSINLIPAIDEHDGNVIEIFRYFVPLHFLCENLWGHSFDLINMKHT